jgi:hypothetical protein
MCPLHLTKKWCREVMAIIPTASPRIVERYRQLVPLAKCRAKPKFAEFFIISESHGQARDAMGAGRYREPVNRPYGWDSIRRFMAT